MLSEFQKHNWITPAIFIILLRNSSIELHMEHYTAHNDCLVYLQRHCYHYSNFLITLETAGCILGYQTPIDFLCMWQFSYNPDHYKVLYLDQL